MSEVYAITNLDGYSTQLRIAAANFLTENESQDNLDDFISINQITNLVRDNCIGFDDYDRPLLDEETNEKIFENTVTWIHNVGLAKLAAQDLIECAWDNDANEMIFWAKTKKEKSNVSPRKSRRKNMEDKK